MATTIDPQIAENAARALLNDRISVVRALAQARQNRDGKRAELLEAERADAAAYAAAQRAGWSTEELKKVGLSEPTTKLPGRPRRRARATPPVEHEGAERTAPRRETP